MFMRVQALFIYVHCYLKIPTDKNHICLTVKMEKRFLFIQFRQPNSHIFL